MKLTMILVVNFRSVSLSPKITPRDVSLTRKMSTGCCSFVTGFGPGYLKSLWQLTPRSVLIASHSNQCR